MVIIWPLLGKLAQPVGMQLNPKWTGNAQKPVVVVQLPWNVGTPPLWGVPADSFSRPPKFASKLPWPNVVHQLKPYPPTYFRIAGTTRDASGAPLGNCVVDWFNTADDLKFDTTTSDANGLFEFRTAGQPPNAYYLVAYKAGSPDVAGVSVNTLTGV